MMEGENPETNSVIITFTDLLIVCLSAALEK